MITVADGEVVVVIIIVTGDGGCENNVTDGGGCDIYSDW